ncbi:LysR family transcriptional regulator [Bowmanella yangjiangensis]|uniref:LysR family transcriptional regulator n=1 Tax=Bowmanella yangjiangensis TaxID=2811230 RepID=A0ABS3CSK0_9ALTE|nr:LysR family transcriptional regulator [Bowmanella yangjiangensis]MBN7820097.1 LysR family transcriptional regulator [Bowmanella yangjiangensis]
MDRLNAMAMLVKVTETGSFSAASKALGVPLATLSRKVSDLEKQLGARLIIRTTRKLSLTEAGIHYVAASKRILEQVEEAERQASGEYTQPKGELVITAPQMFGRLHVLPVISEFLAIYPEIKVRLLLADHNLDLIEEDVDMAVRIGRLPDSTMVATQVGTVRVITCVSPLLMLAIEPPTHPEDLLKLPCITQDSNRTPATWRFNQPSTPNSLELAIQSRLSVTNSDTALCAAIRQVGVTRLLHYQAADAITQGKLQIILPEYEPPPQPIHLLHTSRGMMPLKMRSFLDFAAPRLRQRISAL